MRFGPVFKRTSKKTLRWHRARQGAKLFTAEEVQQLIDAVGLQLPLHQREVIPPARTTQ
jgi:hypothetical protein